MAETGESRELDKAGNDNGETSQTTLSSADVILQAVNQLPWVGRPLANFGGFALGAAEGFFESTGITRAVENLSTPGAVGNITSDSARDKNARSRIDSVGKAVNSPEYALNTRQTLARQAAEAYLVKVLLDRLQGEDKILARKELYSVIEGLPAGESLETIGLTSVQLNQLKKHL